MVLYRLGSCNYADDLSGEGARLYGGRWNSEGIPAIYFASSRSLAVLEVLVHLPTALVPDNYCMSTFEVKGEFIEVNLDELPENWQAYPFPKKLQAIGNKFFQKNEFLLLKVPSAIVEGDFNYIANPKHPDIKKMKSLGRNGFSFDRRLI